MIVDCAHYKDGVRQHEEALTPEQAAELAAPRAQASSSGSACTNPSPGDLEQLQKLFGLHELAVEDAQNAHQRPKIEDYDDGRLHRPEDRPLPRGSRGGPLRRDPPLRRPRLRDHRSARARQRARLSARSGSRRAPTCSSSGPPSAVWAVLDKVVDDYLPVVDAIEDDIEEVEKDVFDDDIPAPTARIYNLKREVIEFHRAVWPLLGPLDALEQGDFERVPDELRDATSATSPTTPAGSTSRSARSASC